MPPQPPPPGRKVLPSWALFIVCAAKGSPSSKYEHWRTSALLRNIRNIRIYMGKNPIVSVPCENERISIKTQLTLHKICVTPLLGGLWADFYGLYRKRCSLYIKVYQG